MKDYTELNRYPYRCPLMGKRLGDIIGEIYFETRCRGCKLSSLKCETCKLLIEYKSMKLIHPRDFINLR